MPRNIDEAIATAARLEAPETFDAIAQTIAHVRRWNAGEWMNGYPSDDDYSLAKAVLRAIETGEAAVPGYGKEQP